MPAPNQNQIEAFIKRFRQANPLNDSQIATRFIDTDSFGDSPEMADELLVPILEGEGEGDRTLEYWRKVHWDYFTRTHPKIAKEPTQDMPLLCERFRVIYTENPPTIRGFS